jgi:hypothetical protein
MTSSSPGDPHPEYAERLSLSAARLQEIAEEYRKTTNQDMTPHLRMAVVRAAELADEALAVFDRTFELDDGVASADLPPSDVGPDGD